MPGCNHSSTAQSSDVPAPASSPVSINSTSTAPAASQTRKRLRSEASAAAAVNATETNGDHGTASARRSRLKVQTSFPAVSSMSPAESEDEIDEEVAEELKRKWGITPLSHEVHECCLPPASCLARSLNGRDADWSFQDLAELFGTAEALPSPVPSPTDAAASASKKQRTRTTVNLGYGVNDLLRSHGYIDFTCRSFVLSLQL